MNASLSHMAHSRFCSARWPEPLTASGAAQTCPTCLPSPANQLTFQAESRLSRPLKKGNRFAHRHSSNGAGPLSTSQAEPPETGSGSPSNTRPDHSGFPTSSFIFLCQMTVRIALFLRKSAERKKRCFSAALRVSGTLREGHRLRLIFRNEFGLFNPIK